MNKTVIVIIVVILAVIIFSFVALNGGDDSPAPSLSLALTSSAFSNNGNIPTKYTCDGENISPPLTIENVPQGTQSLVLIMDDPDAVIGVWDHWIVYNIPPETTIISENSVPQDSSQGLTSWDNTGYGGPCPSSGTHNYKFKLYALDILDGAEILRDKNSVEEMMQNHVLEQTVLTGKYSRT